MTAFRSPAPHRPPRLLGKGTLFGTGALVAAGLVLAAPLAAAAHVTVTPDEGTAGAYSVLTFAFSHGCDGSPTTGLTIDIPDTVASLAPEIEPGWTIERVDVETGIPTQLVYTPDAPIESGLRVAFDVQVSFAEEAAGQVAAFPVIQTCAEGQTDWIEIPEDGQDPHSLDAPAPTITIGDAEAAGDAHGHDETTTGDTTGADTTGTGSGAEASGSSTGTPDVLPVALAATGLVLGLTALVISVVSLRRARRP